MVVPCNTAHAFLPRVLCAVDIELLDMIETVGRALKEHNPGIVRVGLLATTGTIKAGLYQERLAQQGIRVLVPAENWQEELVMRGVRRVKGGQRGQPVKEAFVAAAERLIALGAETVIGGCTEVPLVLNPQDISVPFLDPTRILARAAVERVSL